MAASAYNEHVHSTEDGVCSDCRQRDKQFNRLLPKLEQSVYMNRLLSEKCRRLELALKDTELRSRRSRSPELPTEVWSAIFDMATHCNEQAYAPAIHFIAPQIWSESLTTRKAIVAVCRQWSAVGKEFLYRHVVLYRVQQLRALKDVLTQHPEYSHWTHNLEFLQMNPDRDYVDEMCQLLLPSLFPRLRTLSYDPILPTNPVSPSIVAHCLVGRRSSITKLHLSPAIKWNWNHIFSANIGSSEASSSCWPILTTLSVKFAYWDPQNTNIFSGDLHQVLSRTAFPCLHTVFIDWYSNTSDISAFLQRHPKIHTLHINQGWAFDDLDFERLLDILPNLERLSLNQVKGESSTTEQAVRNHRGLRKITILCTDRYRLVGLPSMKYLFKRVGRGQFPNLETIQVLRGAPDGCVDADFELAENEAAGWKEIIQVCKSRRVQLVSSAGQMLHLWRNRHTARYQQIGNASTTDTDSQDDSYMACTDDDDSWTTESAINLGSPVDDDKGEDGNDRTDSEDSSYVYKRQADIEPVHEESDESDWST